MTDPLGTVSATLGVVGVAIKITQIVVQFGKDWKDVPGDVKNFVVNLGTLQTVLSEFHTKIVINPDFAEAFRSRPSLLLSQLGASAPSTSNTKLMLEICKTELECLLKELRRTGRF